MSYQVITEYDSPNYTSYTYVPSVFGYNREIIGIIYHWWGDPSLNPQFYNIISWLCRANGDSSAHVVGEASIIAWIVDAINAAWHAGNARGNALYVGYECNPRLSDGDYQTMGEFHHDMEVAYGRTLEIRLHKEFTATSCSPIDVNRIRQIADNLHAGVQAATAEEVRQAYRDILEREADDGGVQTYTTNGMTIAQVRADLFASEEYRLLQEQKAKEAEEATKPEWTRNLKDIEDIKLSVLPADGIQIIDLTTLQPINNQIIPRGTQIDIAKETTVGGQKFYISSWAASRGAPNGLLADGLGVPAELPEYQKPEWLENLQDIEDQDFWTRSETPVLNLADGKTVETLLINTKVRITHSTEVVGIKLLVLEGDERAIETIYLSDTPITKPEEDLEKKPTLLDLIKRIIDWIIKLLGGKK